MTSPWISRPSRYFRIQAEIMVSSHAHVSAYPPQGGQRTLHRLAERRSSIRSFEELHTRGLDPAERASWLKRLDAAAADYESNREYPMDAWV